MKYNELHKKLRDIGCYRLDEEQAGHPLWYSPKTGKKFQTSHHGSEEVRPGTLHKIIKAAGL